MSPTHGIAEHACNFDRIDMNDSVSKNHKVILYYVKLQKNINKFNKLQRIT
jgi:hypothetical protein